MLAALLLAGCSDASEVMPDPPVEGGWQPGQALPSQREAAPRGLLDVRGLVHAHSVYSHDACDGEPWDEETDAINEPCFDDFRRDMCRVAHDFVMLTDHGERFSRTEFPDTLLYREDRGDRLVERAAEPVASWAACDPGDSPEGAYGEVLVMAGNESAMMPVGLEGHVAETEPMRDMVYGDATAENVATLQARGAVVLAQHTEDWSSEQIMDIGFDGFEMYNLHANTITGAGGVFELLGLLIAEDPDLPHPDLIFLNILNEDDRYLERWGDVLATGYRAVTTIGTDCHRNTFPQLLDDGERVDSYRRMMSWMSNHLLIEPEGDGSWDDRHLKDALRDGRLYGVFEAMGFPDGFDFHADDGGMPVEMGGTASTEARLIANLPSVRDLEGEPPALALVLYRAEPGGWTEVERSEDGLDVVAPMAGAYRVEVRIKPTHLRDDLGAFADVADSELVWIYSNAIFVE